MNYKNIFIPQMAEYLKKQEELSSKASNKALFMAAARANANNYCKVIADEIKRNPQFDTLLGQEWKSVERLIQYIAVKVFSFYVNGCQCLQLPDELVLSWVIEYYNLDDKAEIEKEEAEKKAEAERKAKEEAERKAATEAAKKKVRKAAAEVTKKNAKTAEDKADAAEDKADDKYFVADSAGLYNGGANVTAALAESFGSRFTDEWFTDEKLYAVWSWCDTVVNHGGNTYEKQIEGAAIGQMESVSVYISATALALALYKASKGDITKLPDLIGKKIILIDAEEIAKKETKVKFPCDKDIVEGRVLLLEEHVDGEELIKGVVNQTGGYIFDDEEEEPDLDLDFGDLDGLDDLDLDDIGDLLEV